LSWAELLLVLLGFAVGAYGTIVGAGGGFLLVPALLILYPGYSQQEITSISLFVVLATAVSGSIAYARRRLIDYRTALIFAAVSIPAGFAGALAVRVLPRSAFDVTFGVLLIVLATYLTLTLARGERPAVREPVAPGRFVVRRQMVREEGVVSSYAYDGRQAAGFAAGTGFVATLFGVGGGIIQVPLMTTLMRVPLDIAVATSQFVLIFVAMSGTIVHATEGHLGGTELTRALLLAAGAIVGGQAGAAMSRRLASGTVVVLLAGAMAIVGVRLLLAPYF
jgi:uncharacterized membrane protein YfcA